MRNMIFAALLLSGCHSAPPVATTISMAMSGVENDLMAAHVVGVSHAADWTEDQRNRFDSNTRALQCAQKTSDPLIAMVSGPVTMALSGSFTQSGQFSVGSLTTVPVFGLNAEATRGRTQQLSVPVQFISLSSLPDAEMARMVTFSEALLTQSDAVRTTEAARLTTDREALNIHVAQLIRGFQEAACSKAQPPHPFVGLTRTKSGTITNGGGE